MTELPAAAIEAARERNHAVIDEMLRELPDDDARSIERVMRLFAEFSSIPRPSKREEFITDYLRRFAHERGLIVREDRAMNAGGAANLLLCTPAALDAPRQRVVTLQAHTDMVCQPPAIGVNLEPIELVLGHDEAGDRCLHANGTTLGADNGLGAALALAALEAAQGGSLVAPPLEVLLTIDEETGLNGAKDLDGTLFRGRTLINIDGGPEGQFILGCADSRQRTIRWSMAMSEASAAVGLRVSFSALPGGHSGIDIHLGIPSANKLLAGALRAAGVGRVARVAFVEGGEKSNAIATASQALLVFETAAARDHAATAIANWYEGERAATSRLAKALCRVEEAPAESALSLEDSARVMRILDGIPHGVLRAAENGDPLASNNFSLLRGEVAGGRLHIDITVMARGIGADDSQNVMDAVLGLAAETGGESGPENGSAGWVPSEDSALRRVCEEVWNGLSFPEFPHRARCYTIHAGVECGVIAGRVRAATGEELDMVSCGPRIEDLHTVRERTYPQSIVRFWVFLRALLRALN